MTSPLSSRGWHRQWRNRWAEVHPVRHGLPVLVRKMPIDLAYQNPAVLVATQAAMVIKSIPLITHMLMK
jgi:hypothetical protein